eukprot:scaffold27336_cov35-Cyclotella_meneghiniana.AAC.2
MKLTIAFTSSIATLRAPAISASIVASNILKNENKQGSIRASATENKECTVNGVEEVDVQEMSEDVGILSCDTGELCLEDSTSSLGGRCFSDPSNPVDLGPQRELCEKCVGDDACDGLTDSDKANIACGSCIGMRACKDSPGVTIGANSCKGNYACYYAYVNIGDNSCIGVAACNYIYGDDVPNDTCNGSYACRNKYPPPVPSFKPSSQPSELPSSTPLPSSMPSSQPSTIWTTIWTTEWLAI